jgi:general secretion pathway protein A
MDYSAYWGLTAPLFSARATTTTSPLLDEAMARLLFLAEERRPLGILVGETGMGKTTLLNIVGKRLALRGVTVIHRSLMGRQSYEMLWDIGNQLGARPACGEPLLAIWNALESRIKELALDGARIALLLDDADSALGDAMLQIGRLLTLAERLPNLLTLVIATTRNHLSRFGERILQQAHLRIELDAWTLEETAEFMRRAISARGRSGSPFQPAAIDRLYFLSQGMPCRICRIAELAMMVAATEKREYIDEILIEVLFTEFGQLSAA